MSDEPRLSGSSDELMRAFFNGTLDFRPEFKEEHQEIERGVRDIEKMIRRSSDLDSGDGRIAGGKDQKKDLLKYLADQFKHEKRRDWVADEFLRAVGKHYEDYSNLIYQQTEEIRERRERERRRENEKRNATRAAKDVKFQHEGGRPDFIPNGSKQLDNGTWKAPDGRIFRRSTTHEWTDGDNRYSDEDRRPVNASQQLEGVYAYSRTPWGSYIMVVVVVIIIVIILFH